MLTPVGASAAEAPVAAYSFDEGVGGIAHDSAGNHHGNLHRAEWTEAGKFGSALRFDPAGKARLTIPASPELDFSGAFTLEAWVRPEEARKWAPIFAKTEPTEPAFSYQLYAREGAGLPQAQISGGGSKWADVKGEALPLNTWSHLAVTSDGKDIRLYVNGKVVDTEGAVAVQTTAQALRIGGNEQWNEFFDGTIDNVRIYDKALTGAEVGENSETPVQGVPTPIAAYSFDEGAGGIVHDSTGNHDGTLHGAQWTEAGKFGGALDFDPEKRGRLTIPASPAFNFTGAFTLEAWVRPDQTGEWLPVIAKAEAENPDFGYMLYSANGEGKPQGTLFDGASGWSVPKSSSTLVLSTWSHLALVSDGEDARLYVNGSLVDTEPTVIPQSTNAPLRIGAQEQWNEFFDGRIDNVRIYDKALTGAEVGENSETPVQGVPTPIAAYSFDEGSGGIAHDSAGDHDGTIHGAEWVKEGKHGGALSFDPMDSARLTIPAVPEFNFTGAFTLEAWVRPEQTGRWVPVIAKAEAEAENPDFTYMLYSANDKGRPQGTLYDGVSGWSVPKGKEPLPLNAWSHLALISDGEYTYLYIDGKLIDTEEAVTPQSTNAPLRIGAHEQWNEFFDGRIDDVRIYDEALNGEELTEDIETPVRAVPLPVAAYAFDEGAGGIAHDSAGDHDGKLIGAQWTEAGKYGGALDFEPANSARLTIPASPELNFTSAFTLEAWVRPEQTGKWVPVIAKAEAENPDFGYVLYSANEGGKPQGTIRDSGEGWSVPTGKEALALNTWSHLTLVSDGEDARLYVNGTLVDTDSAVNPRSTNAPLRIGAHEQWNEFFDGRIDNVRIYDQALTSEEVAEDTETPVRAVPIPIAAYSFDEGAGGIAQDSAGNNDGTLKNGVEWTGSGKFGSAVRFDGVDDLITIPASSELNLSKSFTVEVWVRPQALTAYNSVLTKEAGSFHTYALMPEGNNSAPKAEVGKNSTENNTVNGTSKLPMNEWSHLTLTSDGSHLRLYVNGSQAGSTSNTSVYTAEGATQIGGNLVDSEYFKGTADEVRIYNRALSSEEISDDKNTGIGWSQQNRLVAAYSFDEESGVVAHDSVGGHDGNLKNGVEWGSGKFGSSVRFDGVNDLVTIPAADDLNLSRNFTIEAWVKPDTSTPYNSALTKEAGSFHTYALMPEGNNSAPKAEVGKNSTENNTVNGTGKLPLETWSHLALTSDREHLRLYVNGTQVGSTPNTSVYTADGATQIGGNLVDSEYFDGFVDEVRLYNRTLSGPEISADKEIGIGWDPESRLIAAYAFEEGEGAVAEDSAGNHDGKLKNGAEWSAAGRFGSGVRFDGVDDLVTVPAARDLNLSKDFTIETWVKPDALAPYNSVLTKEAGSFHTYALMPEGNNSAPKAEVGKSSTENNTVNGTAKLPLSQWSHLALTSDGQHLRLYVNGTQVGSTPNTSVYTADGATQIGGNLLDGEYFKGTADEVRIYNRTLSKDEVADDRDTPIGAPAEEGEPAINTSNFADVWCITSSTCFAVGDSDASGSDQWQVKRWTAGVSGWVTQKLAAPGGAAFSRLNGVSCSSSYFCLAVGSYEDDRAGDTFALAAEWDGEDWQQLAVPKPEGADEALLSAVFCITGGTCVAVGRYVDSSGVQKSLAMTWNGHKWTMTTVPTPSGGSVPELTDVSCVSTSECRAVGSYVDSAAALRGLMTVWNGTNWGLGSAPVPTGATATSLSGISCISTICVASGYYADSMGVQQPLALQRASGTWSVMSVPTPSGALATELTEVSCTSTTSCTAVGSYKDERKRLPLVLALASGSWSIQPAESADYGAVGLELTGVSCNATNNCHLVGSITYGHGAPRREFSYYRSEGAWVADKPEQLHRPWVRAGVGVVISRLADVSCPTGSISACVSVGTVESGREEVTEHQVGSVGTGTDPAAQSAASGPSGAIRSSLLGVSCTSTSSCWAVGNFHNATEGGRKNFGTRWNGSAWTPAALPAPEAAVGAFSEAVSCGSASNCVAVGGWIDSEDAEKPLAVRWNGTSWSQVNPTPPSGALQTTLNDVSCASATKCAAVGGYTDSEGGLHPLAYSWDGSTWSSISISALSGGYQDEFTTVSCSTGSCFGLGRYVDGSGRPVAFATKPSTSESMTAWTSVTLPVPADARALGIQSIDCTDASRCLAVGDRDTGAARTPWAASWNGSSWASSPISFDMAKGAARPLGADCVSSSSCALVGYASSATWSRRENLFAQVSWPSPGEKIGVEDSVGAASSGSMSAASCTQIGGYTCIGVGNISGPLVKHSYASSVSGWSKGDAGWKEIDQPTGIADASGSPSVTDVDCYAATACTATGGSSTTPQISRWNGSAWSKQTAAAPAESTSQAIEGVSCPFSGSCAAVGYFVKQGVEHPVAYRWKEGTWSTEALDLLNLSNKRLKDISCAGASSCVAVGYSALTSAGVIYEWNGSAWASKTVPTIPGSSSSDLVGVSCTAVDQCTAVGTYKETGSSKERGLVLRWNGTAWTQQDDSEAAETKSYSAVSCYSRVGCVATAAAYGASPAVVLAWNGSEWSEEEAYVGGSGTTPVVSFKDVSCASAFDCVVVGKISGAAETESVLALEPLPGYADGEITEWEEQEGGGGEALSYGFDETQEAQITDIIAHDPLVRQKLGGAEYSVEMGPWTTELKGTETLAGAVALLHLDTPRDWPRFEQWTIVSAFPRHEPKDYGQTHLELKASKVTEVLIFVAAVQDAEGNLIGGEVVGIEPQSDGPAEYMLGPNVEIDESLAGVND